MPASSRSRSRRCRFRHSCERTKLLQPGETMRLHIELFATANLFLAGHRLRLDVSSSCLPKFDVNPNTGAPAISERRWQVARNTAFFRQNAAITADRREVKSTALFETAAEAEMAQYLCIMAPGRTTRKFVSLKIGLADAKLVGQIGNRFVRNLGRGGGENSGRGKELQLRRQPTLDPTGFVFTKSMSTNERLHCPASSSGETHKPIRSLPAPGANFQTTIPTRSIRSGKVPQLGPKCHQLRAVPAWPQEHLGAGEQPAPVLLPTTPPFCGSASRVPPVCGRVRLSWQAPIVAQNTQAPPSGNRQEDSTSPYILQGSSRTLSSDAASGI
jgi:hypothetical protein